MAHSTDVRPRAGAGPALLVLRVASIATLLTLLWQFVSAGNYSGIGDPAWLYSHSVGAILVHVAAGLAVLAAAALWWRSGAPAWPAALAAVVFVLTFVQALVAADMSWHIPGAMILVVGATMVTVWSLRPTPRPTGRVPATS